MSPTERARMALRDPMIAALRAGLAAEPPEAGDRVVLFGSVARGDFDGCSDLDVLVVGGDWMRMPLLYRHIPDRSFETFVVSTDEWKAGGGIVDAARREGVLLWERAPADHGNGTT